MNAWQVSFINSSDEEGEDREGQSVGEAAVDLPSTLFFGVRGEQASTAAEALELHNSAG